MRPSGTARRMSRGTSEDLLADCITHRPPQQLLPTSLRCLPAKGRRIVAHGLGCKGRLRMAPTAPNPPSRSCHLPPLPFLWLVCARGRSPWVGGRARRRLPHTSERKGRGGRWQEREGGGGGLQTLGQTEKKKRGNEAGRRRGRRKDQCSRSAIRRSGSSGSLP